jgi:putative membrane protein
MRRSGRITAVGAVLLVAPVAHAHEAGAAHAAGARVDSWWPWDALVVTLLVGSALVYGTGVRALWSHAGLGHGLGRIRALSFGGGLALVAVALLSPLDRASEVLFSAHMAQHEVLTLLAPPLLVLGAPHVAFAWALPSRSRSRVLTALRSPALLSLFRTLTAPVFALVVHLAVLSLWHLPALFELALRSEAVHALQHATFLGTAALFWWSLLAGRYGRLGYGAGVIFVFVTAIYSGTLGALIAVARSTWYPTHAARTWATGVDALADQQLAGLLMWIPGGIVLLTCALALFGAWLGELERRHRSER